MKLRHGYYESLAEFHDPTRFGVSSQTDDPVAVGVLVIIWFGFSSGA